MVSGFAHFYYYSVIRHLILLSSYCEYLLEIMLYTTFNLLGETFNYCIILLMLVTPKLCNSLRMDYYMNEKILFAARKFKERIVRKGKRYEKENFIRCLSSSNGNNNVYWLWKKIRQGS